MNILFYSTSSNIYEGEAVKTITLPSWKNQWESLASSHPEHNFIIATQRPGMFLLDLKENEIAEKSEKINYHIIQNDDEKKIAEELLELKPDIAIAVSFYVMPYDWLTIKDAMVADFLRELGIKTICHSVETSMICFDKWQTHQFLEKSEINHAKAVYLHHELYINAGNRRELKSNVYTTAVFHEIKKLHFPLIIKDTTGLSSFGADVVNSFDEAYGVLHSKKTTSDRIIEEMIRGEQFGCEIYGNFDEKNGTGDYTVLPPFMFSVNQYGITSPKQSVKIGPFLKSNKEQNERYKLDDLHEMLLKLANGLKLNGIAQVDLIFTGENWYVIEINPRLSGMSTTYAASAALPLSEMIFNELKINSCMDAAKRQKAASFWEQKTCHDRMSINIKFPILAEKALYALKALPYVDFVNQIENKAAKQIREQGYCEVILTGETKENLRINLLDLKERFSNHSEESFFKSALNLLKSL